MSTSAEQAINENILLRKDDNGVTTLTLNRSKQYNALSEKMLSVLQDEFDTIAADDAVRVVILAANGRAFSAGHDLYEMRTKPDEAYYRDLFRRCGDLMKTIVHLPQPVIAKVQGIATAAGCQLVGTCDLAVASENATFAVSGVNLGLFCSTPSVALTRNVSRKRAFEMLFTGDFIDARTAERYGLVNQVVAEDELDNVIRGYTQSICAKSPVAVRTGKQMFQNQLEKSLDEAYDYAAGVMACNMMANDAVEGIDAFLHKREPQWRGD